MLRHEYISKVPQFVSVNLDILRDVIDCKFLFIKN